MQVGSPEPLAKIMMARYYEANLGRFLAVDPSKSSQDLGSPQSWNRYTYGSDNPLNFVDPNGLDDTIFQKAASSVISFGQDVKDFGDSLNNGTPAGITADAALGTAGSMIQGFGDALNVGTATGNAIGSGKGGTDLVSAVATDVGRACTISLAVLSGAQALGVPSTTVGGTSIPTADGTINVPSGSVRGPAENGNGVVYRPAGSTGNANAARAAGPDAQNPSGYGRSYNSTGQPIDLRTGKPGPNSATHPALTGSATTSPVKPIPVPAKKQP